MAGHDLTAARLREILDYDPETGVFRWRVPVGRWGRIKPGTVAGGPNFYGHLRLFIEGKFFYCHRLAWLYVTGGWPDGDIDHLDGDRSNNRFSNLRDVTHQPNTENRRKAHRGKSSKLPLGVSVDKRDGAYSASIMVNGKSIALGRYVSPELAHAAYLDAKRRMHEGCTI